MLVGLIEELWRDGADTWFTADANTCDSAVTVGSGEQERTVANSGESQQQCLQRFCQSWQRIQVWSGRRESNPRSQLGNGSRA